MPEASEYLYPRTCKKTYPNNQGELKMAAKKTENQPSRKATARQGKAPAKKKAVAKKAPAKKKAAAKKIAKVKYTAEQVYSMIEQAAYFAAENDKFGKDPATYWAQAEAAIKTMVKG